MSTLRRRCLICGVMIASGSKCSTCGTRTAMGWDNAWLRLARAAIQAQPWCTDCGQMHLATNPLTGDHLRWPAVTLADVDVVCRRCNSRRGAKRRTYSDLRSRPEVSESELSKESEPLPGFA